MQISIKTRMENIIERVRPYNVEYLYRYKTCSSHEVDDIFTKQRIRFPSPLKFNDPFDCKPKIIFQGKYKEKKNFLINLAKSKNPSIKNKSIKTILKIKSSLKKFRNTEYVNKIFEEYKELFGLYCLSEIPDNLLMWSHYADSHKGFCLQFKSDNIDTIIGKAYKVRYQKEYPVVNLMDINNPESCFNIFATKSYHWEYEKEWRIIKTPDEGGPGWYDFEPDLLEGVILGARIGNDCREKIINLINGYPKKISVYQAELNGSEFGVDIRALIINKNYKLTTASTRTPQTARVR